MHSKIGASRTSGSPRAIIDQVLKLVVASSRKPVTQDHNFGKPRRCAGDLTEILFGVTFLTHRGRKHALGTGATGVFLS
jgi:hypothetical protein